MFDVDNQAGGNFCTFEDMETAGTRLLALFSGYLFDWSRAWGFTHTSFLPEFMESIVSLFKIFLLYFLDCCVHCTLSSLFAIKHILLLYIYINGLRNCDIAKVLSRRP